MTTLDQLTGGRMVLGVGLGAPPAAPAAATDLVGPLAEAGATWWAECIWDDLERAEPMVRRADQGPPPLA